MEDNTIDKKKEEEDVSTIKGGDYQYTPKEGFVLSLSLLYCSWIKRSADFEF